MNAAEAAEAVLAALERGEAAVELVVVGSELPAVPPGSRAVAGAEGLTGTLGDAGLDALALEIGRNALDDDRAGSHPIEIGSGSCTLFVQPHRPPDPLVIVGAGHIARPLAQVGALLGYRVLVLDDRPGFATAERFPGAERVMRVDFSAPFAEVPLSRRTRLVLVTRGHRYDFEALRVALRAPEPPGYIGMVGSQRRVRATLEQLVREGFGPEELSVIHAPVGLDVGAETPEEIAVAIAAELVRERRGGSGAPLRDRARVVERWVGRNR